jgi:hypothetical protein
MYRKLLSNIKVFTLLTLLIFSATNSQAQESVAHKWSEALLQAIRNDFARPTVHARNLFHTSIAMYDSWAIYTPQAETFFLGKTVGDYTCAMIPIDFPGNVQEAQEKAMSYAAYRLLRHRFQNSPGANASFAIFDNLMDELGYDKDFTSVDYLSGDAGALGNYLAGCLVNFGLGDHSQEQFSYNNFFYEPVNEPLVTDFPGNPSIIDLNRWQPLTLDVFIDQSGNEIPFNTPDFLSPEWGQVTPFALKSEDLTIYNRDGFDYWVYHDPGNPPFIDETGSSATTEAYQWGFSLVSLWSGHLDPSDGVMVDISPATIGNVPMDAYPTDIAGLNDFYNVDGGDPSVGHDMNPITGQPYPPQIVPLGDYGRVLAEFWADGPDSETPPGHWFTLLNYVNDHPQFEKRWKGQGPIIDDLEWDVKAYMLMGGAMHDAAITAWGVKGWYDYLRPISAIRVMGDRGQSTDITASNYHPAGLPLITSKIETVEMGDPLAGTNNEHIGKIKVFSWKGPDYIFNPATDVAGCDWILAEKWFPYQRPSFVTPPFAGYVSGHSTYSRAAADIMTMMTGDEFFPGGVGEFEAPMDDFLVFEKGPSQNLTLQWATYRDASDQCSLSRIWGGIHPPADDIPGRLMGIEIAKDAFELAESYFFRDEDEDGYYDYEDCDDLDPNVNPGATEICDGIDNNCSGFIDDGLTLFTYYRDQDGDNFGNVAVTIDTCMMTAPMGFVTNDMDCNDFNAGINPDAPEVCDDIDNNCNGIVNDGLTVNTYFKDNDNDNFGDAAISIDTCLAIPPAGFVTNDMDCDDANSSINPGNMEFCDGIDNNCSGFIDDGLLVTTYYRDADADTFGDATISMDTCLSVPPAGFVVNASDCDDTNSDINPNQPEFCDGIDNNCSGFADDNLTVTTYFKDVDGDGFGDAAISMDTCLMTAPAGFVVDDSDCNDANNQIFPNAVDVPDNGVDEDCTGFDLFEKLKIFPNPVANVLTIHHPFEGEMDIEIVAASGQTVYRGNITFVANQTTVDFSNYPRGVYWVRLTEKNGKKIFIERIVRS